MTRRQFRWLLASLVARLPSSALRLAVYRAVLGYRFGAGTRIGFGVTIAVDSFDCAEHVTIRRGTSFLGPIAVRLASHTFIGRFNKIECGEGAAQASVSHMNYARRFETGEDSLVNEGHHFDVLGRVAIGRGTWIAGFGSQFLTHGASAVDRDITIGDHCFVGSAVRFAPGSGVDDRVIVGMGSVVTKRIAESDAVVAGVPARFIKRREADDGYRFQKNW
jgi:acetyltransferase-like isoleucine patch superfamily enzyme